jgi:diamine N-acetyltransferase
MNNSIYLRPLVLEDAKVSYQWRNNPEIWKYSRFTPANSISIETEMNWLSEVLKRHDQIRFAICLKDSHTYIGNVQLIKITSVDAEFHLFIGDTAWWGKGIGRTSTQLLLNYAFTERKLQKVSLEVHRDNSSAIAIYNGQGFEHKELSSPYKLMELTDTRYIAYQIQKQENSYHNNTN